MGKSALVAKGLEIPAKKKGIAFCGGKFDLNNKALPYSAFAQALSGLAKYVAARPDADKIRKDIGEALGEEDIDMLSSAMQGCEDFFEPAEVANKDNEVGNNNSDENNDNNGKKRSSGRSSGRRSESKSEKKNQTGGKEAVNRLKYAIRRLMRVVCTNLVEGVVLFIDDLQWSDSSSLNLFQSLIQDEEISSLLLVGAYRDDEVSDSHPMSMHVKETERLGSIVTTIKLGNLDRGMVQALVAEILDMEDIPEEVEALAEIVREYHLQSVYHTSVYTNKNELFSYTTHNMHAICQCLQTRKRRVSINV